MPLFQDLAKSLAPPEDENLHHLYKWRLTVAMAVLFTGGFQVLSVMFALGMIHGVSGFAFASDVNDLKQQQLTYEKTLTNTKNEIMSTIIGSQLFTLQVNRCEALKAKNVSAAQLISQSIGDKQREFFFLSGATYTLQSCPELGVQ